MVVSLPSWLWQIGPGFAFGPLDSTGPFLGMHVGTTELVNPRLSSGVANMELLVAALSATQRKVLGRGWEEAVELMCWKRQGCRSSVSCEAGRPPLLGPPCFSVLGLSPPVGAPERVHFLHCFSSFQWLLLLKA